MVPSCPFFRPRPVVSPYARQKMMEAGSKGKGKGGKGKKGPDGQKGAPLSELDMLVGDVLHFNHRVSNEYVVRHGHGVSACLAFLKTTGVLF